MHHVEDLKTLLEMTSISHVELQILNKHHLLVLIHTISISFSLYINLDGMY